MVHIDNVPHILANGITQRNSVSANPNYMPIGDGDIIQTRNARHIYYHSNGVEYAGHICIGDYIPFYFGYRTPMLYVIQNGYNGVPVQPAENIIYVVCSVQNIIDNNLPFYFTDGHAIDAISNCFDQTYVGGLTDLVDLPATRIHDWTLERDAKRKMEAEFLVGSDIPTACIVGVVCYNQNSQNILVNYGIPQEQIVVAPNRYF